MIGSEFMPPEDPAFTGAGIPAAFSVVFAVVVVLVVAGLAFSVFVGIRKYTVIKKSGHDPFTVDAAVAAKVLNSDLLRPGTAVDDSAPARSLEQRLSDIDDLHARGVISEEERSAARAAILAG